jgi:hypothetical protein
MALTSPHVGLGTGIGFGVESTWGTAVSRTNWLPATDSGSDLRKQTVILPVPELVHGSNSDIKNTFVSSEETTGGFEVLARYDGLGLLLQAALGGTPSTSGTGSPYTHTYGLDNALPALTVEKIRGSTGNSEVFEGFVVGDWTFSAQAGQPVRFAVNGIAETSAARGSAGTPTYSTGELVIATQATTATFNGASYDFESITITGNNNISPVQEIGRLTTAEPPISNFREFRGNAVLNFRADTLQVAHHAGTTGDLVLTFTGGTSPNAFTVTLKNAIIMSVDDEISGADVIKINIEFMGRAAASADSIEFEIVNGTASAVAN